MYIRADNSRKTAARIPHPYTLGMMVGLFAVCDRWRRAAGGGETAGLGSHLLFDSHSSDDVIQLLDGESCACIRASHGNREENAADEVPASKTKMQEQMHSGNCVLKYSVLKKRFGGKTSD